MARQPRRQSGRQPRASGAAQDQPQLPRPRGRARTRYHPYIGRALTHRRIHPYFEASAPPDAPFIVRETEYRISRTSGARYRTTIQRDARLEDPTLAQRTSAMEFTSSFAASAAQSNNDNTSFGSNIASSSNTLPAHTAFNHAEAAPFPTVSTHPICDEDPTFFWGTTDFDLVEREMLAAPALHCLPALPCCNTAAHGGEDAIPHRVCRACHQRADNHFRLTDPSLLSPKFVPLCQPCGEVALARCRQLHGPRADDCVCFTFSAGNWECFDCRETSLMHARARWEGEWKMQPVGLPPGTGFVECRCGNDLVQELAMGRITVRRFLCVGCEGVKEMAVSPAVVATEGYEEREGNAFMGGGEMGSWTGMGGHEEDEGNAFMAAGEMSRWTGMGGHGEGEGNAIVEDDGMGYWTGLGGEEEDEDEGNVMTGEGVFMGEGGMGM